MRRAFAKRPYENWIPFYLNYNLGPSSYPFHPGSCHDLGLSSHPFHPGSNARLLNGISNPALDSARAAAIFISCSFPQSIGIGICWKGIDWTTESDRLCSSDDGFRGLAGFFRVNRSALSPN